MKTVLSFGLEPLAPRMFLGWQQLHLPLIEVRRRPIEEPPLSDCLRDAASYSHLCFTSKSAVELFFSALEILGVKCREAPHLLLVGEATAKRAACWLPTALQTIAPTADAEGMVALLNALSIAGSERLFWPHAAAARQLLCEAAEQRGIAFTSCILYDTLEAIPQFLPNFCEIDALFFSSPSTVRAFFHLFGRPLDHLQIFSIGPQTSLELQLHGLSTAAYPSLGSSL